jgi:hypothetical protein
VNSRFRYNRRVFIVLVQGISTCTVYYRSLSAQDCVDDCYVSHEEAF